MAVDDLYTKACDAVEKGNYDYAIALFREVLRAEPEYPKARMALRLCERRRLAERGNAILAKGLRFLKRLPSLVRAYALQNKPDRALEAIEGFLVDNPSFVPALVKAGLTARKAGLVQASIDVFRDALTLSPANKTCLRELSELYEEVGARSDALVMMDRLIKLEPTNQELRSRFKNLEALEHMEKHKIDHTTVGEGRFREFVRDQAQADELEREQQFTRQSNVDVALQRTLEGLKADPTDPTKVVSAAKLYAQKGDYGKAQELLKEALKAKPDNYILRECYGDLVLEALDERVARIDANLKKDPLKVELKQKKAELMRKKRMIRVQEYEWRTRQHPTDHMLRLKLGHALFDIERLDQSIMAFQQASQDPRLLVEAATMLGDCFERKKQYDLAVEQYERAIERNPQMNDRGKKLHYRLAGAYEQAGQLDKALGIYKKIYSVDISFQDVAQKVQTLGAR
jgi:tetratricopeptide (TPR) repeat protein